MGGRGAEGPSGLVLAATAALTAGLVATSSVALATVAGGDGASAGRAGVGHAEPAGQGVGHAVGGVAANRQPSTPTPSPRSSPAARHTPSGPVVYRVRRGDNLTAIARWFRLHGYGTLYRRNQDVIGADPNLIRPGQVITVSPAGARISR